MDSDVEMVEHNSLPPDSQHPSPLAAGIDDTASAGHDDPTLSDAAPKATTDAKAKGKSASGKPKSTKARARSPSPSPPPPAPPPPLKTIRLEIKLGGPDNYEVDVAALAKATGQRPATPPPVAKRYESESDGEGARESGVGTDGGGEKKAKKVRVCVMIFPVLIVLSHRVMRECRRGKKT